MRVKEPHHGFRSHVQIHHRGTRRTVQLKPKVDAANWKASTAWFPASFNGEPHLHDIRPQGLQFRLCHKRNYFTHQPNPHQAPVGIGDVLASLHRVSSMPNCEVLENPQYVPFQHHESKITSNGHRRTTLLAGLNRHGLESARISMRCRDRCV